MAGACQAYGQRVQYSVFECSLTPAQFASLEHRLLGIISADEDSLRIYRLLEPRDRHVRVYGADPRIDFYGPLVV